MHAFKQQIDPIVKYYNRWINGIYLSDLLQVRGGQQAGSDYISKVYQSRYHEIQQKYDSTVQSVRNPTYTTFLNDNLFRLFGLNAFQRLITAYQAYPVLTARFSYPGTLSHTFTQITNEGLFSGLMKGSILAALQFSLILYPATYLSNKSQNKYFTFLSSYTLLDALLYPVDTVKTIMYAETHNNLNLRKAFQSASFGNLYKGLLLKLAFNIPSLTSIYLTAKGDNNFLTAVSWLATAALYPLNALKVRYQMKGTPFASTNKITQSFGASSYRGVVPYLLLNAFIGWTLRPLYSEKRIKEIDTQTRAQKLAKVGRQ